MNNFEEALKWHKASVGDPADLSGKDRNSFYTVCRALEIALSMEFGEKLKEMEKPDAE